MPDESTNNPTPEVPDWCERALRGLQDAAIAGSLGDLSPAERDLVDATSVLLRARFGLSSIPDTANETAAFLIRRALRLVEAAS